MGQCERCGRKRSEGWLLKDGCCFHCNPEPFNRRIKELKRQADEIKKEYLD